MCEYGQIQLHHRYRLYTKEELLTRYIQVENHRVGVGACMLNMLGTVITILVLSEPWMFFDQPPLFRCEELPDYWFPCEWLSMATELGNIY